ncbi:MAG: hypothetical protein HQ510_04410 [Candidatus Marinimicrobia bacterium]|nr:hypothetical protein [Candidatus Neomarinimicrobiota bacterium]
METYHSTKSSEHKSNTPWGGIIMIVLGALFLMGTLDILDFGHIIHGWWPIIIVIVGFFKLKGESKSGGAVIFIVGIILLTATLDFINWGEILQFWPVLLVLLGISMVSKSRNKKVWTFSKTSEANSDTVHTSVLFGGSNQSINSEQFQGGDVQAIFGGIELDLKNVKVSESGAVLNLTALFGGVEITAPANCRVVMNGTPILGGMENRVNCEDDQAPVIQCNCTIAFGGIEVHN